MGNTPKTIGLIPARGGSKGIKNKNIVPLAGKPLIQYTIEAATQSKLLSDCIVSTDDQAIADAAKRCGTKTPFLRPAELATDDARSQDVALHALDAYDPDNSFEYVCLLQPTSPLRIAADIDECIRLAEEHDADSVLSFTNTDTYHPYQTYFIDADGSGGNRPSARQAFDYELGVPRQEFPPAVYRNGAIFLTRIAYLRKHRSFIAKDVVPYIMPANRSVNIDVKEDLRYAEFLLSETSSSTR